MLNTPYGRAELVKIAFGFGLKVRLCTSGHCMWLAGWEVY